MRCPASSPTAKCSSSTTEDEASLGAAEIAGDTLIVRNGYVGRPTVLALADVQRITPADEHEDIEG